MFDYFLASPQFFLMKSLKPKVFVKVRRRIRR